MKKDKNTLNNLSQKELVPSNGSGSGLAMGLSLGVLFGIVTDNIGLGVMLGVAVGLCTGPAISAQYNKVSAFTQKSSPALPSPLVLAISVVTSFKISFSEWMYAKGL